MSEETYTGPGKNVFWMPMDQLGDSLILTNDFLSWSHAWPTLERELNRAEWADLEEDIGRFGLEEPVELQVRMGSWRSYVVLTNGHHRVTALRRLGWKKFPYRWFPLGYGPPNFKDRPLDLEEVLYGEKIREESK